MNWYCWDTDIGQALACAASVDAARQQVLSTLAPGDLAFEDLRSALQTEPRMLSGETFAVMAWHQ